MKQIGFVAALALGVLVTGVADAQTSARVRGTITAVEGNTLSVRSREGENLALRMPDNVAVSVAKAIRFEDIKQGDYVGAATMRQPDGSMVAIEVHYLAPTVPQGQTPWDLEPGSTMTNANVAASVSATGTRELTLQFKGGSQKIIVPESAGLVRAVPGTRADLKPGEYVFAIVQKGADGALAAPRIQVSKDGVRPPQ
ncbi:MAG: hypothetical protein A2V78_12160 [Betaproteobacteria bacterium RBG_16_64_18]|nr:MAG: hypothetical protein A2V78_12160 [Betaproteobacteria bacterium RBG_16_64_18]OGA08911.1 MAG: hypothetical protein A3H33_06240 [Betaproteobacteria bacterium RIFCSPLOWO2_02_FULL_65_20]OGA39471.1 MAG: hypothetical protein A3G26_03070 [Betaproteobacteria bacterium RIFCSPLOWO2_12_FULL_65_110]